MAVHREKSLSYDGPLREGRGWWVLAAQHVRTTIGYRRTKLVVPLLWVAPLVAALLAVAEYVFTGQTGSVQAPDGRAAGTFLQMQFYSLALLYAICCADVVSHDLRYNTTPLFFSKPIKQWEYPVGKLLGLVGLGSAVTVVPAAAVGALRVALYSQYDLAGTVAADVGITVILSLLMTVVSGAVLLGISSTTQRTGFAALAWLGVAVVPEVAGTIAGLSTEASEYTGLMSIQGSIDALSTILVAGELTSLSAALPVLALAIWTGAGLSLITWRVRNLEEGP
jgi:ABC-2 type transport system permease protein